MYSLQAAGFPGKNYKFRCEVRYTAENKHKAVHTVSREKTCLLCLQCISADGVLQQIGDTLGKANGIAIVRMQHMLQVCLGLRNKAFCKDASTGLHQ